MQNIRNAIRNVPDFPKPGIQFKDITPLLEDPQLSREIVDAFEEKLRGMKIDAIVGVESRGFLFGFALAARLHVPFILVRKSGKLPYKTIGTEYALEYGTARVEMHVDALREGWNVLVHDDLLATGGTAEAAAKLIGMQKARVAGFTFVVELGFLNGRKRLEAYSDKVLSLVAYDGE